MYNENDELETQKRFALFLFLQLAAFINQLFTKSTENNKKQKKCGARGKLRMFFPLSFRFRRREYPIATRRQKEELRAQQRAFPRAANADGTRFSTGRICFGANDVNAPSDGRKGARPAPHKCDSHSIYAKIVTQRNSIHSNYIKRSGKTRVGGKKE